LNTENSSAKSGMPNPDQSLLTIDVEDYYHICDTIGIPPVSEWDSLPGRVVENLRKLLDIAESHQVRTTCFFLGYIARRYPDLEKEADSRGHEIASHGMYHQLAFNMSVKEFQEDIASSKKLLEDITGKDVSSYRCPSFSVTGQTPWFFEQVVKAGYSIDSSVFPGHREGGGLATKEKYPHRIDTPAGKLFEIPISLINILGRNTCFFGGGYLRLFPLSIILLMSEQIHKQGYPVLYYIHPREIDPLHPRFRIQWIHYIKRYINLKSVRPKLDAILKTGTYSTCRELKQMYIMKDKL